MNGLEMLEKMLENAAHAEAWPMLHCSRNWHPALNAIRLPIECLSIVY